MKLERTKNAVRNIWYGGILKIYQLIVPFIMRTIMIYVMGVEYLGLNSLFTSVLQVLNLAELGVGTAMVYSMYEPITRDDTKTLCALMKLYRLYYRIIGAVVLAAGLALLPAIPLLIHSDVPAGISVQILYLMNLGATVLSYWFLAYKASIFQACQRTDVINRVTLVMEIFKTVLQLAALLILQNYYLYVLALLASQAASNLVVALLAGKMYPECKTRGKLPKEQVRVINGRIKDLFLVKVGTVFTDSVDTIVISAFLGLTALAVYQNYLYLVTAMIGLMAVIFNACTAGIGNSLLTETREKNYHDLEVLTFVIAWIAGTGSICFFCLAQPFVEEWVGRDLMLKFPMVLWLGLNFYVYEISYVLLSYKDAAGIWHKDRFRSWITSLTNLILNLILVQYFGVYGIVAATVAAKLLVGLPWLMQNVFSLIFPGEYRGKYIKRLLAYTGAALLVGGMVYALCCRITLGPLTTFLLRLPICLAGTTLGFWFCFRCFPEFADARRLLMRILRRADGK